jgi:hypothetical protein
MNMSPRRRDRMPEELKLHTSTSTRNVTKLIPLTPLYLSHIPCLPVALMNPLKAKPVPLHTMKTLGGRGDIAPTHSQPQY